MELSDKNLEEIALAIKKAEKETSGEIRVHIDTKPTHENIPVIEKAIQIFNHLEMYKTQQRNGVLIFLNLKERKFAIIGDKGITDVVPENFWDDIKDLMRYYFKRNQIKTGLTKGIEQIGLRLKKYFPYHHDDINELPNHVSVD